MIPFLPMDSATLNIALAQFQRVSIVVAAVVGLILTARISLLLVTLGSSEGYGAVFKDAIIYFVAISIFPSLMRVLVDTTGGLALAISFEPSEQKTDLVGGYFEAVRSNLGVLSIFMDLGKLSVPYLASAVYSVLISILIAIGPIVILLATLLGGGGVMPYANSLIVLCLWPLTWNLLGALSAEVAKGFTGTSIGLFCFWIVVQALQILSPLFSIFLFKSLSAGEAFRRPLATYAAIKTFGASHIAKKQFRGRK